MAAVKDTNEFTFLDGTTIVHTTLAGGYIAVNEIYRFAPYEGMTLQDTLDVMEIESSDLNKIELNKLEDICYNYGDEGFEYEYTMELGISGGNMATEIANLWAEECLGRADEFENGVLVGEDWAYFDCITIDPDQAEDDEAYLENEKRHVTNLVAKNEHFAQELQNILDDIENLTGYGYYIIRYRLDYLESPTENL